MDIRAFYQFILALGSLVPFFLCTLVFSFPFFQKIFGFGFANILFMWFMNVTVPYIFFIGVGFYFLGRQKTVVATHKLMYAAPLGLSLLQGVYYYGWYSYLKLVNQVPSGFWGESFEMALYTIGVFYAYLLVTHFIFLKGKSSDEPLPRIMTRNFNEKNFGMNPPSFFFFVVGMILICISFGKIIFEVMEVIYSKTHADYTDDSIDLLLPSLGLVFSWFIHLLNDDEVEDGSRVPYEKSVAYDKKKQIKTMWQWVFGIALILTSIEIFYGTGELIVWIWCVAILLCLVLSWEFLDDISTSLLGSKTTTITHHCPYCNAKLGNRDRLAENGARYPCPKCGGAITA